MQSSLSSSGPGLEKLLAVLPFGAPVGLADVNNPIRSEPNEIVLGVGLSSGAAAGLLAGMGPDAVLVLDRPESSSDEAADGEAADGEAADAAPTGAGLDPRVVVKPAGVSWRELHAALVQPRLQINDDLADLAQTIATLTGGLVTIEDTEARVLAYSRSSDEVDELRRLSILGRSGPAEYLALLREWGIYHRLATSEEVVEIAEHPASGVRRRLAVGIFAGRRQLGTIWVQQGRTEFGPHARGALLGAARLTAAELVGARPRANRLADLLDGRIAVESLGADAARPAVVAVCELVPVSEDSASRQQKLDQLSAVATVHAAGLRRRSLTERIGDRIVILLPALDDSSTAEVMLEQAVAAASRVTDAPVRAGLGLVAKTPRQAGAALRQAEYALQAHPAGPVSRFDRVRNQLLVRAVVNCLDRQRDLLDPALDRLISVEPEVARTLLRYLDTGSDVSRVATEMAIHPTTVRYRLRRVATVLEVDLAEPDDRLSVQLQLRRGLAPERIPGMIYPYGGKGSEEP